MKNLKKVLAMVLAFACTFTMFASAKMYEDVQPGTEFSEAITMLSDLGVIQGKTDNKYHPEDTITRAEACMLITRLMTGDPTAAGFGGAHHFKDVPAGHWASSAIGYCVVNGVAVGVDAAGTKFEPNRPIKDKEFVTMVVRALGYETPDMKQNFPFGYMSAARAIGLLEDVNMIPDTDALRGEDAQVIYNAMFADYARGAKRTNVAHGTSVETYPTLAESIWHLNRAALGTWNKKDNEDVTLSNCKAHTWVILGEAQDEENALLALAIDDNEDTDLYKSEEKKHQYKAYKFKYEGTADIDALRGYKVELWGAGKHGEPVWEKDGEKFVYSNDWKIKAIKTVKNQTKFDYNPSMADRKSKDGSIELNEETKLSLGSAADNAKLVKQEQGVKEVVTFAADELNTIKVKDGDALEEALNVRNGMQYQLIDWNNDKEIDWVVVDEARYYKVESATSKRVNVTSMAGDNLKSDKDSVTETWKLDGSEKIGKNLADKDVKIKYEVPEGLKEGDIVEVTYKVTYDGAQMITATVKVVDAENEKLEKVATRDGLTLTFGDKEVKIAQNARKDGGDVIVPANPEKYAGFNGEELGTEFALTKNRNGFIVYSDYATESSNYMMVLNTYGGDDSTGKRDLAVIDFVDANNKEHKDVKVSSGARILDKDGDTLATSTQKAYVAREFDESQVVGNVFKYWTDADGVITKMQAMFDTEDTTFKHADEYEYDADADRLINRESGINNEYVASLEDAKVIFAVKNNYVMTESHGGVIRNTPDLRVNSADVLATKQKDIPDIGKDPEDVVMLGDKLQDKNAWMGNKNTAYKFAAQVDKNGEASAAILGVENFNKFSAGQTKLALVTNVSENSKGIVEAEVAYNGEITTLSSAEKQDFEDIVKVFDGYEDHDVTGTDATISAGGNFIFDGEKLSEVVNQSGQYAEVTVDAEGKLTKVVFMDDDSNGDPREFNDNKLRGHYYTVSRNLVVEVTDKNLKYHLNDNKTYGNDLAAQRYAGDDNKLQTVKRLPAQSAGYADDAKFYQIDSAPTRHDKNYEGTRLTVNAGFNDIENRDIKAIEKMDVAAVDFNNKNTKNVYEVADLAFNSDNDLVAVFSFKNDMDEKADYEYVAPAKDYKVSKIQFVKNNGTIDADLETIPGHKNQFVVYVTGDVVEARSANTPVSGLTKDNFEVMFGGANNTVRIKDVTEMKNKDGYYTITLDQDIDTTKAVIVTVVKGGHAAEIVDGGVKVEDKTPEIGVEGGNPNPDASVEGLTYKIVSVEGSEQNIVLEFVDKTGATVSVKNVMVAGDPTAQVVYNGKTVTINSSSSLSEAKLTVDGVIVTLPELADGNAKSITVTAASTPNYKLASQNGKTAVEVAKDIATKNIAAGAKIEVVEFNAGITNLTAQNFRVKGDKVEAVADELNTAKPGTVKFKLRVDGVKSTEISFEIKKVDDITADATVFDPKTGYLTLTMNKEYAVLKSELETADWESALKVKGASTNLITDSAMELLGEPTVTIAGGKTTVALKLKLLADATVNKADSVTASNVMADVTLSSGTTIKPKSAISIARDDLKTFEFAQGTDKKTIEVTVDNEEAAQYLATQKDAFELKTKTGDGNNIGTAGTAYSGTITLTAEGSKVVLKLSTDLTASDYFAVGLKVTNLYKAEAMPTNATQQVQ